MTTEILWAFLVGGAGVLLLAGTITFLLAARREANSGRILSVDRAASPGPLLRSGSWKLAGRPDEIRVRPDGRRVPVEIKSRAAPRRTPPESHLAQIWAYCLLIEETTGRSPPFGILRYGDGREFKIPWDSDARSWLWKVRCEVGRPYAGQDHASPRRCANCGFRMSCDRAVA